VACVVNGNGGELGGVQGIVVGGVCVPVGSTGPGGVAPPTTKTIECGVASLNGWRWNPACGLSMRTCYRTGTTTRVDAFATLTLDPTTNTWGNPVVWCPQDTTPGPDPATLREQAIRLLPTVAIGTAPRADTLVNIETILWADTTATRDLGTVTVTGIKVHLRARVRHAPGPSATTPATPPPTPAPPTPRPIPAAPPPAPATTATPTATPAPTPSPPPSPGTPNTNSPAARGPTSPPTSTDALRAPPSPSTRPGASSSRIEPRRRLRPKLCTNIIEQ
jgi:hypothetical protein